MEFNKTQKSSKVQKKLKDVKRVVKRNVAYKSKLIQFEAVRNKSKTCLIETDGLNNETWDAYLGLLKQRKSVKEISSALNLTEYFVATKLKLCLTIKQRMEYCIIMDNRNRLLYGDPASAIPLMYAARLEGDMRAVQALCREHHISIRTLKVYLECEDFIRYSNTIYAKDTHGIYKFWKDYTNKEYTSLPHSVILDTAKESHNGTK